MSNDPQPTSIIAVDIGSALTHVCLVDRVAGVAHEASGSDTAHRFIAHADAPTTLAAPENDITLGVRRAIRQLERITQRRLLDEEQPLMPERDSGEGFDALVATLSAAPPLQCLILGLTDDLSLESAERACLSSNATVARTVRLGPHQKEWADDGVGPTLIDWLRTSPPDVVVITGGIDRGPTAPLEAAAEVLALVYADIDPDLRPMIIFAGNQEARRPVAQAAMGPAAEELFDYRVVDNVRPGVDTETLAELQRELAAAYVQRKLASLPGYRKLREWCAVPIASTLEALGTTWRYIARRNKLQQGVLGVDVGSTATCIASAQDTIYQWAVGAKLGTGFGIRELLAHGETSGSGSIVDASLWSAPWSLDAVHRWLPSPIEPQDTLSHLENMALRPYGIPQTMDDLLLTHAVIRQAMLLTMRRMRRQHWHRAPDLTPSGAMPSSAMPSSAMPSSAMPSTPSGLPDNPEAVITPPFDLIAVRGGAIVRTPMDGLIALSVLDALQPTGLSRLVLDWASIWPQLGIIARIAPLVASQVLERDSYRDLGTLIAPIGEARDGEHALNIIIRRDDGEVIDSDIPAGEVRRFPLALHEYADVEVRPSRAFDIGLGRKGFGGRARVRGGTLGIVVDTRGRPLGLPQVPALRRERLRHWLASLTESDEEPHSPPGGSMSAPQEQTPLDLKEESPDMMWRHDQ
jgi:hypothetical protein